MTTEFPRSEEYLSERNELSRTQQPWQLLLELYDEDELTELTLGETQVVPVFTSEQWLSVTETADERIQDQRSETKKDTSWTNEAMLSHNAHLQALVEGDSLDDVDYEDYTYNGEIFRFTDINPSDETIGVGLSDWFSMESHTHNLREELYASLIEDRDGFPYREQNDPLKDVKTEGVDTLIRGGASLIILLEQDDGLVMPVMKRAETVSTKPGWFDIIPAGMFMPWNADGEPSIENIYHGELGEELFGSDESEFSESEATKRLGTLFEEDDADLVTTGVGLSLYQGVLEFYGCLYVTDEEFANWFIDNHTANWESDEIQWIDVTAEETYDEWFQPDTISPDKLVPIARALEYIQEEHTRTLPVDVDVNPSEEH